MHHMKGVLAIIVSLGLALVPLSVAGDNGAAMVSIDAPAEVDAGSSFVANVAVTSVTNFDSCGFDVVYDHAVIHVTDVTDGQIGGYTIEVGSGDWSYIPAPGPDQGRIRVTATRSGAPGPGVSGTGYLAQIHFEAVGSGGDCSDIDLETVAMYDYTGEPISTTTEGDSVCILSPVGGTAYPPNKLLMVLPWIVLGAAIIVGASLLVRRRRNAVQ